MRSKIPAGRIIHRFIEYHRGPFTVSDIVRDTGLFRKTVQNLIPDFVRDGRLKLLSRERQGNIYVKALPADKDVTEQYDWRPDRAKLRWIYDLVGMHIRLQDIQKNSGFSNETIYRYLRILVADGCVEKFGSYYRQVTFKPTLRAYHHYHGFSTRSMKNKRTEMILEIIWMCKRVNEQLPEIDSKTNDFDLMMLKDDILTRNLGVFYYD